MGSATVSVSTAGIGAATWTAVSAVASVLRLRRSRASVSTRGMSAALPHADHFLAGNSVASLEELAELLESGMETT